MDRFPFSVASMNLLKKQTFFLSSLPTLEDILIKRLLITHDPDDRWIDSEMLLRLVGNIMSHASTSEVPDSKFSAMPKDDSSNMELLCSSEPIGYTIKQILCNCSGQDDMHSKTMGLFDVLWNYKWDAKVVLVLSAFALRYGEFWQLMQLCNFSPLAVSIARLKQYPRDLGPLKQQLKALSYLVKTMMEVAKCIVDFEALPLSAVELDYETISATKSHTYVAVYWIIRSTLTCISQVITGFISKKNKNSDSKVIAVWELSSLALRLAKICSILRRQVDACHQEIDRKMPEKLLNVFHKVHLDNQEVLRLLFASGDDLPLKHCSTQTKLGVSDMKNKVVMLLITKPQLLSPEELLLLVQQTSEHYQNQNVEGSYSIVWIPISSSDIWSEAEEANFYLLSNSLPWYSVWKPWSLSSAVVNYIREDWNYKGNPIMVALDSCGEVSNLNALDMVWIWGPRAYPFTASKEAELWRLSRWSIQLLMEDIGPLLAFWVQENKNVCIYGSQDLEWAQQLSAKMREIRIAGLQLEIFYVGIRDLNEHVKEIIVRNDKVNLSPSLSFTKLKFFWIRLESMRRSIAQHKETPNSDHVLEELSALLDFNEKDSGWAIIGTGTKTDAVKLQGGQVMECLNKFSGWVGNITKLGLGGAIRSAFGWNDPSHEEPPNGTPICEVCKRPKKKFVVFE